MSTNPSGPQRPTPVVVLRAGQSDVHRYLMRLIPAALASLVVHGVLLLLFFLLSPSARMEARVEPAASETINADLPTEEPLASFLSADLDPRMSDRDVDTNYPIEHLDKISIPGDLHPDQAAGLRDSPKDAPAVSVPTPGGFHGGTGGGIDWIGKSGNTTSSRDPGGDDPRSFLLPDSLQGRSGSTRAQALRSGGGTEASEVAVGKGLKWLIRQQQPDGRWMLNGPTLAPRDRGTESNDIAATALGLLPLLAAGKTHKPSMVNSDGNPYDKNIDKALKFLMRSQDPKTGYFGVNMYGHGLATIALCEAYALSQDPVLRRPAQAGIKLIVNVQHEDGGWRYGPLRQPGDLSISGWQIMALKSGQMAGLDVPRASILKAIHFLDTCCNSVDEGYGYVGPGNSQRMTAVALLCRQYIQNWGPAHPRMITSIGRHLKTNPPDRQDVYYYYYATQVMHHFGGEAWKSWNETMREFLVKSQDKNESSPHFGSWSAAGDPYGPNGGRLMMTSLNLLTLEVYYRYLPLYYRDAGYKADVAVQKAQ